MLITNSQVMEMVVLALVCVWGGGGLYFCYLITVPYVSWSVCAAFQLSGGGYKRTSRRETQFDFSIFQVRVLRVTVRTPPGDGGTGTGTYHVACFRDHVLTARAYVRFEWQTRSNVGNRV